MGFRPCRRWKRSFLLSFTPPTSGLKATYTCMENGVNSGEDEWNEIRWSGGKKRTTRDSAGQDPKDKSKKRRTKRKKKREKKNEKSEDPGRDYEEISFSRIKEPSAPVGCLRASTEEYFQNYFLAVRLTR
ncbi:hypothetical protein K0M31_019810 [Melipona bicolor]|uniref:Uncharacterized protein n=1 Tax=Melipona bicolor TaxID=60889 RepID=A0AA40KRH9_9HYME|nr:hypothetical protein K0M31_019810 [Melipona bicolor]